MPALSHLLEECCGCGMHEIFNPFNSYAPRPPTPRTFRPLRQRSRVRFAGDTKSSPSAGQTGGVPMDTKSVGGDNEKPEPPWDNLIDRATLCLPHFEKDSIIHGGEEGFKDILRQYLPTAESNASERLVVLKCRLRVASTHDFWSILMEEMCGITGSQCGFVAKRMLVDDQDSAVEMPELGEPGSCLMGVAFYINDGDNPKELYRDYRYHAYGTPCAYMKHDKVFIVPERMTEFLPNNPNPMPWERSEAFIGVPLFTEGKCFAHFGMIWSSEGAKKRELSWSFIEMFLHSLEDMILQRILEGRGFAKEVAPLHSTSAKVIPLSAITASQSLKPYARSLSHELRTPMQGVVGMLDIMYSTVLDAISNQQNERARAVFRELKDHIEVVQDSSRRAVEAADNVVHAYDLNMQMPETPLTPNEMDMGESKMAPAAHHRSNSAAYSEKFPSPLSRKHYRAEDFDYQAGLPPKRMFMTTRSEMQQPYPSDEAILMSDGPTFTLTETNPSTKAPSEVVSVTEVEPSDYFTPTIHTPTYRHINAREFMQSLVNDALGNDHPTREVHKDTDLGETIEVTTINSRGDKQNRVIDLKIESDVPEVVVTEEQHLQFAVRKLVDNAMKFTERGRITITVKFARNSRVVEIWIVDTGCGIAEGSKSSLFKPHFQEDASIRRSRDGLGLSLFNAKAHVRKHLGGDLTLERSDTGGPLRGSEFLIRLPISKLDPKFSNAPLLGTPPLAVHHPNRPPPWIDNGFLPVPAFLDSVASPEPAPHQKTSRKPKNRQKRVAFNPKLAEEYPLNILIAEDNTINRNVAIGSLSKLGYKNQYITVAVDGLEAVKKYEASLSLPPEQHIDAILMDIWMPNMDGYESAMRISDLAREHGQQTKVIAVTADITEDSIERAKKAGMQGFLAKPYKVFDIEQLIVQRLQKN